MEKLQVLVVDDERGMRLGVERSLRGFSVQLPDIEGAVAFELESAETGEAGLDLLRAKHRDIVLLDHKLPGIQGLEMLDLITREHRDVLTVMITAYASIETAVTATKRGAYDFLAKPFTPGELRATLEKAAHRVILERHARRLAREKRQLRYQLMGVVSHELKAPLAAIEGYLQLLREGSAVSDPATRQHLIERSLVRLDGMRKLIFDLLDLTRIESGQRKRELRDVDLIGVARTALETARAAARERELTLSLEAPDSLHLSADPAELEIVLNNLLSNAVKYNRDGGSVTVTIADLGDKISLKVADTGIGLTAAEQDRLFGEFVRIRNSKTQNILGSGLGLSIVKRLAAFYGGEVGVESTPDVGTTFTVTLLKESSPSPEASGKEPPEP